MLYALLRTPASGEDRLTWSMTQLPQPLENYFDVEMLCKVKKEGFCTGFFSCRDFSARCKKKKPQDGFGTICVVLCLIKKGPKHRCIFVVVVSIFDRSNGILRLLELDMEHQTGSK